MKVTMHAGDYTWTWNLPICEEDEVDQDGDCFTREAAEDLIRQSQERPVSVSWGTRPDDPIFGKLSIRSMGCEPPTT